AGCSHPESRGDHQPPARRRDYLVTPPGTRRRLRRRERETILDAEPELTCNHRLGTPLQDGADEPGAPLEAHPQGGGSSWAGGG
ncbi:MAG: hypothetical protein ACPIOQ_84005, partial [Promethearchaeia archaeon]